MAVAMVSILPLPPQKKEAKTTAAHFEIPVTIYHYRALTDVTLVSILPQDLARTLCSYS
jgi:hypothetical protein